MPSGGSSTRLSEDETSLSKVADWGPAEDWRDWDHRDRGDAAR